MHCKKSRWIMAREHHGGVSAEAREKLSAHLAACAPCRRMRQETRTLLGRIRSELLPVPRIDVVSRVMARVHQAAPSLARVDVLGRRQVTLSLGTGTAIAAALAAGALIRAPSLLRGRPVVEVAVWVPKLLAETGRRILETIHFLVEILASSLRILNTVAGQLEFLAPASVISMAVLAAGVLGTTAILVRRDLVRHRSGAPWQGGKW